MKEYMLLHRIALFNQEICSYFFLCSFLTLGNAPQKRSAICEICNLRALVNKDFPDVHTLNYFLRRKTSSCFIRDEALSRIYSLLLWNINRVWSASWEGLRCIFKIYRNAASLKRNQNTDTCNLCLCPLRRPETRDLSIKLPSRRQLPTRKDKTIRIHGGWLHGWRFPVPFTIFRENCTR